MKKPLVLTILDGYGMSDCREVSAISKAKTPRITEFFAKYPNTTLRASGMDVGLPEGQMGNSEVGHTNIGAGRIVYQELTRITKSILDGDFFENKALCQVMEECRDSGKKLHLMGLLSDGGVHSHHSHLYALIEMAKKIGLQHIYVHCLLDGRDVPPNSGLDFVRQLEEKLASIGAGKIATVMGRYFAMDRDNRWDRVEKAYNAMTMAEGEMAATGSTAVENSYANQVFDEFVLPTVVDKMGTIDAGDGVIFFNFRPDRAREITRTFVDTEFSGFVRKKFSKVHYVCMTQYDAMMPEVSVAFLPQELTHTFGEYISKKGLSQLRIAETEKYAHVTFFFNGGVEQNYPGEDRCLIPSPKVATYDLLPQMSAFEVKEAVVEKIRSGKYDVIVLNFANCDMVGHTGMMDAAIAAVEAVDTCVGEVVDAVISMDGQVIITADHGNADRMIDNDGGPFTAHTTNPVPMILIGGKDRSLRSGCLADIAPTMLALLSLEKPSEMTGESLII